MTCNPKPKKGPLDALDNMVENGGFHNLHEGGAKKGNQKAGRVKGGLGGPLNSLDNMVEQGGFNKLRESAKKIAKKAKGRK
jgi:hypothetical protein